MVNSTQITKWLVGGLFAVATGLGSLAVQNVSTRVTALEQTRVPTAERMAALEVEVRGLRQDVQRLETAIHELSDKIDRGEHAR